MSIGIFMYSLDFMLFLQDVGVATTAASPTQCYLDYVTLPNDNSTLLDLKQSVAILLSHLDRIATPYCNMSIDDDKEEVSVLSVQCDVVWGGDDFAHARQMTSPWVTVGTVSE